MKTVAIIGAGPAGLSAAYTLLTESEEYRVTIFEKESVLGGLSKTFTFEGGNIDIGGHRFFTKSNEVQNLWDTILPCGEKLMLERDRKSHILWAGKLIDYPIQLNAQTLKALGITKGTNVALSYLYERMNPTVVETLEDFYVSRFGRELYRLFFKDYTQKLWGIPADRISPDWGTQRVQKVSLSTLLHSILFQQNERHSNERSLITKYHYPAYGCGQMWETLGKKIIEYGGIIKTDCSVEHLIQCNSRVTAVEYAEGSKHHVESFDYIISSMPMKDLLLSIDGLPDRIKEIGMHLHYRDMMIAAIEIPKSQMGASFQIAQKDSWLYMQDCDMTFGRVQILNNWSPYAVTSPESILLELEFFCGKDDPLWETDDGQLIQQSMAELARCGLCQDKAAPIHSVVKRIEKAYPVYADGYYKLDVIKCWLDNIDNLRCIGRNGQHRYNNMDHSVETGIEAARSILKENYDRRELWDVNGKQEYLEKQSQEY